MKEKDEKKQEQEATEEKKSGKKKTGLWALIAVLVIALASFGGWYWWNQNNKMDATTKYWFDKMAKDGTLEGKTPMELQGMLNAIVEEGMFNVSINANAIFPDGASEGSLGFENVPENRYYCRMILRRDDDNSVLYESDGLKPGQYIDKIKLKKSLPAGTYPSTAQIIATDPETLDDIGQVQVKIQVIILN